jgi:hypothetical protein
MTGHGAVDMGLEVTTCGVINLIKIGKYLNLNHEQIREE